MNQEMNELCSIANAMCASGVRGNGVGMDFLVRLYRGAAIFGIMSNETAIEIGKSEPLLNGMEGLWFRPICNCLQFLGVHANAI